MPDFPPIYLLRHGQTDWNAIRRIQGQLESDLTETGQAQATRQGEILTQLGQPAPANAIYCSPLRRTRQTAALALPQDQARIQFDDRLKEIGMGDWQGMLYAEVAAAWPDYFATLNTSFDICTGAMGGEGFAALNDRAARFLADLRQPSVIVAHGIINMVLRGLLLGLDRRGMAGLDAEQGCVVVIENGIEKIFRQSA